MSFMKCLLSISLLLILVVPLRAEVLVGEKPKLKIPAMDGSAIDLAALHGKLVLIDFWVGRSDLNQRNEETLKDLYKSYNDQGLEIIGICCDFNATQAASELLAEVDSLITAKDYAKAADKLVPLLQALKGLPEEQSARQKLWALNSDPTAKAAIDSARREIEASAQLDMARKLRDDGK